MQIAASRQGWFGGDSFEVLGREFGNRADPAVTFT
jgi:hypothetical protein